MAEVARCAGERPIMVTLSGGNPAIQPLGPLIAAGHARGYRFAMETQGSVARDWFGDLDMLVLSPKPPSSGMEVDWAAFDACRAAGQGAETVLKIVVFDAADYDWAREVAGRYPDLPLYLQPGNHTPPPPETTARRSITRGSTRGCAGWSGGWSPTAGTARRCCRNCT